MLAALLLAWWADIAPVRALRLWAFDLVQAIQPVSAAGPSPVVVVDIDDESLARVGRWPWPRDRLADIVARLADRGAAVVVLDLLLAEPDRLHQRDRALAAALQRLPTVAGAAIPASRGGAAPADPVVGRFAIRGLPDPGHLPRAEFLVPALPVLEAAAAGIGVLNLYPDIDGVMRTVPGGILVGGRLFPGLAIEAVRVAAGASGMMLDVPGSLGAEGILVAGHLVPTDREGRIWIDAGDPGRIPVLPAHRILQAPGAIPDLRGRVIVLGVSAAGVATALRTADGEVVTGPIFQGMAIDSILAGRVQARPPAMHVMEASVAALLGVAIIVIAPWLTLPLLGLLAGGLILVLAAAAVVLSLGPGLLADGSFPLLVGLVLTGQVALVRMREQVLIRRQQAEVLARQDAYMRRVVDASFDAIVTVDERARILTANEGAERLFGVALAHLPGRRIDAMLPGFWPTVAGPGARRILDDAVRSHQVLPIAAAHAEGTEVPAEMTIARAEMEQPVFVIVLRDIRARLGAEEAARRADERLRDGIGRITDGFALFGPDRRLVICNNRFVALLGPAGAIAHPGIDYQDLMGRYARGPGAPVDAKDRADAWLAERLAHFGEAGTPRVQEHLDGRWFRVDERPTADGGLVTIYSDITELKLHEKEMIEAMRRAETASAAKSAFLANMSHELRTPLNAVIGFADIMKQELFGPLGSDQYRSYVADISGSGTKLLDMIESILEFSRAEQKPAASPGAQCRPTDVIAAVLRDLQPTAQQQGVALLPTGSENAPAILAVDASILYQILQNLVSNAIKFSHPASNVWISWRHDDDGCPTLSVADQGIGIPEDLIGQLTEPFWQRQGVLARSHAGVGLGLAIVKSHVDKLQGELRFDSREGEGTTVTVMFPAACRVADDAGAPSQSA